MGDLKVGDEVRIFDQNGRRMGQPDSGWPGTVAKIGRTLVHIECRGRTSQYRLDSHRNSDGFKWFSTLDEVAEMERAERARQTLREHRITLDFGHGLTLEQVEALADVARTFGKETP